MGGRTPSRADARAGEDVWLTGPIGDAYLGLMALREGAHEQAELIARYRLPNPRVDCAGLVAECARAAMDVSDGLVIDAGKLARASNAGTRLELERVPISPAARSWMEGRAAAIDLVSGGDDYEILFTASPNERAKLESAGMYRIGNIAEGSEAVLVDANGRRLEPAHSGHVHKLGN